MFSSWTQSNTEISLAAETTPEKKYIIHPANSFNLSHRLGTDLSHYIPFAWDLHESRRPMRQANRNALETYDILGVKLNVFTSALCKLYV